MGIMEKYAGPWALTLKEQAEYGLLPDALRPCEIAELWAAELGKSATWQEEMETIMFRWMFDNIAVDTAPGEYDGSLRYGQKMTRDEFRRRLEADGDPLPRFWFAEEDCRAAQAHQAALARHGYTTVDELGAKKKARQLWQKDPAISKATMRKLCAVKGKLCPQTWIDEVHKSLNLPKNRGGRPRRR